MQHVVAVVELKYPDRVVGLCFLLSPAKFITKEWEHFFFCLLRLLFYQHLLYVRVVKVVFQDNLETVESEP